MKQSKLVIAVAMTILAIALMAYLQIAFRGADVKTAVRLIEEARAGGVTLKERMAKVLPFERRLCEASVLNDFQGHMEVTCLDIQERSHILKFQVNVIDGMVKPANEAAVKLGKGEEPWSTK
jgi:hypothetical protein